MPVQMDEYLLVTAVAERQACAARREHAVPAAIACGGRVLSMPRMAVAYPAILTMQDVMAQVRSWRFWPSIRLWLNS